MDGKCSPKDPVFVRKVAVVCCALHNICKRHQCLFEPASSLSVSPPTLLFDCLFGHLELLGVCFSFLLHDLFCSNNAGSVTAESFTDPCPRLSLNRSKNVLKFGQAVSALPCQNLLLLGCTHCLSPLSFDNSCTYSGGPGFNIQLITLHSHFCDFTSPQIFKHIKLIF